MRIIPISIIIQVVKLSQAQFGKKYKIENLSLRQSLAQRMAILGLSAGMMVEVMALYKHGALIKTSFGDIALDSELLDFIVVSLA